MCRCDGEIVDHLLLHCEFAHMLQSEVFLIFRIQWVMLENVTSLCMGGGTGWGSISHMFEICYQHV